MISIALIGWRYHPYKITLIFDDWHIPVQKIFLNDISDGEGMLGYTVPLFARMSPNNARAYQRYYCETCHNLKDGFGLVSTLSVNYDMTFNTIVMNAVCGGSDDFVMTPKSPLCVFKDPYTDSDIFRMMAAYTVLLTKWEIYDDKVDSPSYKTAFVDLTLTRAITKAEEEYPEFDRIVGEGFAGLRALEAEKCSDAVHMGRSFGEALSEPLGIIAGEHDSPELKELFTALTAAVYVIDAVDDIESDFMDGTFNPFLQTDGTFINRMDYMSKHMYELSDTLNRVIGDLQRAYSNIRGDMAFMTEVTDNIVYLGMPESARKALSGTGDGRMTVMNLLERRKERKAVTGRP